MVAYESYKGIDGMRIVYKILWHGSHLPYLFYFNGSILPERGIERLIRLSHALAH
jgi:hypothetical protein